MCNKTFCSPNPGLLLANLFICNSRSAQQAVLSLQSFSYWAKLETFEAQQNCDMQQNICPPNRDLSLAIYFCFQFWKPFKLSKLQNAMCNKVFCLLNQDRPLATHFCLQFWKPLKLSRLQIATCNKTFWPTKLRPTIGHYFVGNSRSAQRSKTTKLSGLSKLNATCNKKFFIHVIIRNHANWKFSTDINSSIGAA